MLHQLNNQMIDKVQFKLVQLVLYGYMQDIYSYSPDFHAQICQVHVFWVLYMVISTNYSFMQCTSKGFFMDYRHCYNIPGIS